MNREFVGREWTAGELRSIEFTISQQAELEACHNAPRFTRERLSAWARHRPHTADELLDDAGVRRVGNCRTFLQSIELPFYVRARRCSDLASSGWRGLSVRNRSLWLQAGRLRGAKLAGALHAREHGAR